MPGVAHFLSGAAYKNIRKSQGGSNMSAINTNVNSLVGLSNLYKTNKGISASLEKLSSGYRINKAADDPSGLAIASTMTAQIGGIRMAVQNAEDGANMIQTADGALAETEAILQRMRDLAVRSSNSAVLTASDKGKLEREYLALYTEITRKSTAVTFNTKILFGGAIANSTLLQVGPDKGQTIAVRISAITCAGLGIAATHVSGAAASAALSGLTTALSRVGTVRAGLGITQRRLGHIVNDLMAADINISAAKSRIMDADMASEISEFTRLQILQQSGTAILAQANAQPQSVLQLLG